MRADELVESKEYIIIEEKQWEDNFTGRKLTEENFPEDQFLEDISSVDMSLEEKIIDEKFKEQASCGGVNVIIQQIGKRPKTAQHQNMTAPCNPRNKNYSALQQHTDSPLKRPITATVDD